MTAATTAPMRAIVAGARWTPSPIEFCGTSKNDPLPFADGTLFKLTLAPVGYHQPDAEDRRSFTGEVTFGSNVVGIDVSASLTADIEPGRYLAELFDVTDPRDPVSLIKRPVEVIQSLDQVSELGGGVSLPASASTGNTVVLVSKEVILDGQAAARVGSTRFDVVQGLTDPQKATARENLGLASVGDLTAVRDETIQAKDDALEVVAAGSTILDAVPIAEQARDDAQGFAGDAATSAAGAAAAVPGVAVRTDQLYLSGQLVRKGRFYPLVQNAAGETPLSLDVMGAWRGVDFISASSHAPIWKGNKAPFITATDRTTGDKLGLLWAEREQGRPVLRGAGLLAKTGKSYGVERRVEIPSGLGWSLAEYSDPAVFLTPDPLAPSARLDLTPTELYGRFTDNYSAPSAEYWVSASGADGASVTGSQSDPFLSGWRAIAAAMDAGIQSVKIHTSNPNLRRDRNWTRGGLQPIEVPHISLIAEGASIITGSWDDFSAPSADSTFTNTYSWVQTATPVRVTDRRLVNSFGNWAELRLAPSAAICNRIPGTWFYDGSRLFVQMGDGAPVTRDICRVFLDAPNLHLTTRGNLFMGGDGLFGRWEFQGSTLTTGYGGGASAPNSTILVDRMTSRYSNDNAIAVNGLHGLFAIFNSHFTAARADGINVHRTSGASISGTVTNVLTINTTRADNGRDGPSRNGLTFHENMQGIDVAGIDRNNRGGSIGHVNYARGLHAGGIVKDDLGDSAGQCAAKFGNEVQAWLDGMQFDIAANTDAIRVTDAAKCFYRNMNPPRGNVNGAITPY